MTKIAVLLAAFNGRNWIEEQINSILNQKDVDVTLFISIDLSEDDTNDLVTSLASVNKNIVVLPYGEIYGSAAANFFRLIREVDISEFNYVALSDQDDIWLDWKLNRAVSMLNESSSVAYSSNMTAFWADGRELLLRKSFRQCKYDHFFESPGAGCTFVFERSVLIGFKSTYESISHLAKNVTINHDWYLYAYVRQLGLSWYIDDCSFIMYRQHSSNEVGVNSGFRNYVSRLNMVVSRWYRAQVENVLDSFAPELKPVLSNRFFLICNFYKLRRRPRDRFALLFMLLFGLY
jgi:rhamnosyltransferase